MAKIVVLGAGVMGSAFTMPLADNGHTVSLVGTHLDADIVEEIHETRVHPRLKSRLRDAVTPYTYDRLGEVIQGADLVVVGVNSLGIDWAGEMLRPVLPPGIPLPACWSALALPACCRRWRLRRVGRCRRLRRIGRRWRC